jgi:hypothetical protein
MAAAAAWVRLAVAAVQAVMKSCVTWRKTAWRAHVPLLMMGGLRLGAALCSSGRIASVKYPIAAHDLHIVVWGEVWSGTRVSPCMLESC